MDAWSADPELGSLLGNEIGTYLGTVIVKRIPGAAWKVWSNGHPVAPSIRIIRR